MSFDSSDNDFIDEFESVPLPTQIPDPIKVSSADGIKSRTIQSMINQNQDLMARLTISLKRNLEFESRIESLEEKNQNLKTQAQYNKDQSEIYKEKSQRIEHESQKIAEENDRVQEKIKEYESAYQAKQVLEIKVSSLAEENISLEKRFAELYSAYQDKIDLIQKLSLRLHRYINYRTKISKIVRPFVEKIKDKSKILQKNILTQQETIFNQTEQLESLNIKLGEIKEKALLTQKQNEEDQKQLVHYHESRYLNTSNELKTQFSLNEALKESNAQLQSSMSNLKKSIEELKETEVDLHNKAIFYERKYEDLKSEFEDVSRDFLDQNSKNKQNISTLETSNQDLLKSNKELHDFSGKQSEEIHSLVDQLQSLQILYQNLQENLEKVKNEKSAQEQINRDLSRALSEYRKTSVDLKEKLRLSEEDFKNKLQSFKVHFSKPNLTLANASYALPSQKENERKNILSKIQSLLSEIQTGLPQPSDALTEVKSLNKEEILSNENEPLHVVENEELISEQGEIS